MTDPRTNAFEFLPIDACPECGQDGAPRALAESASSRVVRYVCPQCKLCWDCVWSSSEFFAFTDATIGPDEGLRAPNYEVRREELAKSWLKNEPTRGGGAEQSSEVPRGST